MFRHLRTKLTVLYAGLFAVILLLVSAVALGAVSVNARQMVRKELETSSAVFEGVWAQRAAQLENDGELLSHDFGFRSAIASHDDPTISSALDNLKVRLGIDRAMMIGADGRVISARETAQPLDAAAQAALKSDETTSGVLLLDGAPYEAVSVPIGGGGQAGWLVFAAKLDRRQMTSLETLAAIPLTASVAYQTADGRWRDNVGALGDASPDRLAQFFKAAFAQRGGAPLIFDGRQGAAMASVQPLHLLGQGRPVALVLQYPLAKAMAPYNLLLGLLLAAGGLGLAAVVVGARLLARSVTRPIISLEAAARRLQHGEGAQVAVETRDEIGRLAEGFNAMAAEIKQRERELESARDNAEAANRAKSSFLANMSHEVRTPLNGVIGVAGVLAGSGLTGEQQDMVGVIQNSATLLQRVLDDVLDLARVEAGRMDMLADDFDLGEALRAFADGVKVQCEAKGLSFEFELDPAADTATRGDRIRLEQILGNLLSNALKFTAKGGVALRASREADSVRFTVADTGIGFDAALAGQLFTPFQQADGSITRNYGGTGLGLSISRKLAEAMGGALTATATPGEGATFTLTLPLVAVERPAVASLPEAVADEPAADPPPAADPSEAGAIRVLVADDHETNRLVVKLILDGIGVEVTCVEDGEQAVSAFAAGGFDLVFMDMQMPVMDGLTANRAIREIERTRGLRRTPILMLSANAMPEHVKAALESGADAHVAKPITPPRLVEALQRGLALVDEAAPDQTVVA
jgi:signal transduction histidine kinase/CheY-like chemotaxis protein